MADPRFRSEPYIRELRPFQRASVNQVIDVLYRRKTSRRYLVADETGLGKSMVARGVIAAAIEELQDDPNIERIDIVYICSNADVARQNVKRLDVLGTKVNLSTRLSLLAASAHQLNSPVTSVGKPVNLVSLTPRTSFPDKGWRTGTSDERSLLFLILRDKLELTGARATAAYRILSGTIQWSRFKERTARFEANVGSSVSTNRPRLDPAVVDTFLTLIARPSADGKSTLDEFEDLVENTVGRSAVPGGYGTAAELVIKLRRTLARAGVEALQPDLIILDEFQRFTELLTGDQPVSELAQAMFNYSAARVLLLSATPYKPFDLEDSIEPGAGRLAKPSATHRDEFVGTLDFLKQPDGDSANIVQLLGEFRNLVVRGEDPSNVRNQLRVELLAIMSRTERPSTASATMVRERLTPASAVTASDVQQFIGLSELAQYLQTRIPMDVWKSVPDLVHFMDSYDLGKRVSANRDDASVQAMLDSLVRLDAHIVNSFEELPQANPRLQTLIDQTTGASWHHMLWIPPSLPYFRPAGPYASFQAQTMTKKLIFSQWTATPTSVASLLSHDASRRIATSDANAHRGLTATTTDHVAQRLQFRRSGTDLSSMTSFMLFCPLPDLAEQCDPRLFAGDSGGATLCADSEAQVAATFGRKIQSGAQHSSASTASAMYWRWPLSISGALLDDALSAPPTELAKAMAGDVRDPNDPEAPDHHDQATLLSEYLGQVLEVRNSARASDEAVPGDLALRTAQLAMHSPGNCAWRALGRLSVDSSQVSVRGRWQAAAVLASGLRTLFNRWESSLILDDLYRGDSPYWQKVLRYCANGNLQSLLDEYLYHLASVEGDNAFSDDSLLQFAFRASQPLKLSTAVYRGKNPLGGDDIDFRARFALRYGDTKQETHDEKSMRSTDIREAFNSPFWPFVLVSTSVGQEGIDFHPWCHNLVHWNVPTSPVDFEQRDGRVNRFRGHAIRRNIAHKHESEMLKDPSPWAAGYRLAASDAPHPEIEGLAPDWLYPGPHKVVRDVMPYQLSIDEARIERVKKRVAYYRLAFGQARQEDLISVARTNGVTEDQASNWRVDLRP